MTDVVYEAVAFAMRYWFIIAMAVILIAVISISYYKIISNYRYFTNIKNFYITGFLIFHCFYSNFYYFF